MYHFMEKKFFRSNYRTYVAQFSENGNGNLWCYVESRFKELIKDNGLIFLGRIENKNVIPSEKIREQYDYTVDINSRRLFKVVYTYLDDLAKCPNVVYDRKGMTKTQRYKKIVYLRDVKKLGWPDIATRLGYKSKGSVHEAYHRFKGTYKLSPSKLARVRTTEYNNK